MADSDLDAIRADLRQLALEVRGYRTELNGRLRKLELWKARADGFRAAFHWAEGLLIAAVTAGATAFVTLVVH